MKVGEGLSPLEALIYREEGFRTKPYRCTAGKLTIGIGWNLDAGISWDQAVVIMRGQIADISQYLERKYAWFNKLNDARKAAIVSMAFQLGLGGFDSFKQTHASLAKGDWEEASRRMLESKWAKQTPARARRTAYMVRYGVFDTEGI